MQNKYSIIVAFVVVAIGLWSSCSPSQQDRAAEWTKKSETTLSTGDTLGAITMLDSLLLMTAVSPETTEIINSAKNSRKQLYRGFVLDLKGKVLENDSVIATLEGSFIEEKGEFDRYTQLVHKRQVNKNSWDRSFIKLHLNELGELYLSSNYLGEKWLDHTGIRVYDNGDDAKTTKVALDNVNNFHSDFMEMCWEKVLYKDGAADEVLEFIANNKDRNLKAVFLGKRYFYILLEAYDKEAVYDALAISKRLKRRVKLTQELKKNRDEMNRYN